MSYLPAWPFENAGTALRRAFDSSRCGWLVKVSDGAVKSSLSIEYASCSRSVYL